MIHQENIRMQPPRMRQHKQGTIFKDLASGYTSDSVSWQGFQASIGEKVHELETKMRVHQSNCQQKFEQFSSRIPTHEEVNEMKRALAKINKKQRRRRNG